MKIKVSKTLVLALLLGMAGAVTVKAQTAEVPPLAAAKQPSLQQLSGKVMAVDKKSRTVTVEVNGKTYVLQLEKTTRIAQAPKNGKAGKEQGFDDVKVGEDIAVTVAVTEAADGQVQVTVVRVETLPSEEAGTGGSSAPRSKARGGPALPFPGNSTPNPANIDGNINSPNR